MTDFPTHVSQIATIAEQVNMDPVSLLLDAAALLIVSKNEPLLDATHRLTESAAMFEDTKGFNQLPAGRA
ncbi:MAG: hypothetical protein N4A70_11340 [Pelagimonas sp.]|jgi:hypothetical protein|nr:hypothetical protein [Pelagimonas sp.]